MRSLGLDIGDRRIGIAVSDPLGLLARPLSVLERTTEEADIACIVNLAREQQAEIIIAGMPRSMDGSTGSQAEKVRGLAEKIRAAVSIPLEYRDERLTTVAARDLLAARGKKKKRFHPKGEFDAAAAAVILQSYLNETRPVIYPEEKEE